MKIHNKICAINLLFIFLSLILSSCVTSEETSKEIECQEKKALTKNINDFAEKISNIPLDSLFGYTINIDRRDYTLYSSYFYRLFYCSKKDTTFYFSKKDSAFLRKDSVAFKQNEKKCILAASKRSDSLSFFYIGFNEFIKGGHKYSVDSLEEIDSDFQFWAVPEYSNYIRNLLVLVDKMIKFNVSRIESLECQEEILLIFNYELHCYFLYSNEAIFEGVVQLKKNFYYVPSMHNYKIISN